MIQTIAIERVISVHGTMVEVPTRFKALCNYSAKIVPDEAYPDAVTVTCTPIIGKEMFLEVRVLSATIGPCNGKVVVILEGEVSEDPLKPHHQHTSRENRITDPLVWLEHEDQEIGKNLNSFNKSYAEFIKFAGVAERRRRRWVKEQKQKAGK